MDPNPSFSSPFQSHLAHLENGVVGMQKWCVCASVCAGVCDYLCVQCVHCLHCVWRPRDNISCHPSVIIHLPVSWNISLSRNLPSRLSWMDREPQEPACLHHFSSSGFTGECHPVQLLHMDSWSQTQALMLLWPALDWLSIFSAK